WDGDRLTGDTRGLAHLAACGLVVLLPDEGDDVAGRDPADLLVDAQPTGRDLGQVGPTVGGQSLQDAHRHDVCMHVDRLARTHALRRASGPCVHTRHTSSSKYLLIRFNITIPLK